MQTIVRRRARGVIFVVTGWRRKFAKNHAAVNKSVNCATTPRWVFHLHVESALPILKPSASHEQWLDVTSEINKTSLR